MSNRFLINMEKQKNNSRFHLRNDIILIIVVLVVAAAGMLYLFVFRGSGDTVRVTVDGEIYGVYSLSQNISEDIRTGADKDQLNRLIIRDGVAYMESATCPDGICVAHRPIFREGESIVCLPNRVVVAVITDDDPDSPDIVA